MVDGGRACMNNGFSIKHLRVRVRSTKPTPRRINGGKKKEIGSAEPKIAHIELNNKSLWWSNGSRNSNVFVWFEAISTFSPSPSHSLYFSWGFVFHSFSIEMTNIWTYNYKPHHMWSPHLSPFLIPTPQIGHLFVIFCYLAHGMSLFYCKCIAVFGGRMMRDNNLLKCDASSFHCKWLCDPPVFPARMLLSFCVFSHISFAFVSSFMTAHTTPYSFSTGWKNSNLCSIIV